jgi:hypothetical protein
VKFEPKVPTVFVLVDRSGSEFDSATTGTYFTLRAAALQVIQKLQADVRFGFGAFVGDHASGACVAAFDQVPIAQNNYDAIAAKYTALGPLQPYGSKADTPAEAIIPKVKKLLMDDTGVGQKYMMFVTDSESDFCDDGSALCPADAVTFLIQDMYASGFGTLVIGLPTAVSSISAGVLKNFANAGAGQAVINPPGSGAATLQDIYNQCAGAGNGAWKTMWTAAGRTGLTPLATYGPTAGTAMVYTPASTSQQALADQISLALANVKSCTFDLMANKISVDLKQLSKASVLIDGVVIPLSDTNGWHMTSPTQLELVGTGCDTWRQQNATTIDFNFPCEIIIPG